MIVIPVPKDTPRHSASFVLDGSYYELTMTWNMRAGWFFGIADGDGEVILSPRRACLGVDLLASARGDARTPPGWLGLLPLAPEDRTEPGYNDLVSTINLKTDPQGRIVLAYVPVDEQAAALEADGG